MNLGTGPLANAILAMRGRQATAASQANIAAGGAPPVGGLQPWMTGGQGPSLPLPGQPNPSGAPAPGGKLPYGIPTSQAQANMQGGTNG